MPAYSKIDRVEAAPKFDNTSPAGWGFHAWSDLLDDVASHRPRPVAIIVRPLSSTSAAEAPFSHPIGTELSETGWKSRPMGAVDGYRQEARVEGVEGVEEQEVQLLRKDCRSIGSCAGEKEAEGAQEINRVLETLRLAWRAQEGVSWD
jgi:hypothetical protein